MFATKRTNSEKEGKKRDREKEGERKKPGEVPRDDREKRERIVPDASRVTSALRIRASRAISAACAMQDAGTSPAPDCVLLCPASVNPSRSQIVRSQDGHEKRVDVHMSSEDSTLDIKSGWINQGDSQESRKPETSLENDMIKSFILSCQININCR